MNAELSSFCFLIAISPYPGTPVIPPQIELNSCNSRLELCVYLGLESCSVFHNPCPTVSVLGVDQGYTVKYTPLPEGVPEGAPEGKGVYSTVFPKLSPNLDSISL